jgi:hypothetical protein
MCSEMGKCNDTQSGVAYLSSIHVTWGITLIEDMIFCCFYKIDSNITVTVVILSNECFLEMDWKFISSIISQYLIKHYPSFFHTLLRIFDGVYLNYSVVTVFQFISPQCLLVWEVTGLVQSSVDCFSCCTDTKCMGLGFLLCYIYIFCICYYNYLMK